MDRREFLARSTTAGLVALCGAGCLSGDRKQTSAEMDSDASPDLLFGISLAQWSLHRAIRSGARDNLNFAVDARRDFDIGAVEYVNQFFADRAKDMAYLAEMKTRAEGAGVRSLLIMVDGEGNLGSADAAVRRTAVENHFKWVQAARYLGCHSIRVNAMINEEAGEPEEQMRLSADGLRQLTEFASGLDLNVLVENHGSLSSNGEWLAGVMKAVDHPRCGTLPDFGNFCLDGSPYPPGECRAMYDPYRGVGDLMPFAKAVSAKTYDFVADGTEAILNYDRLLRIVLDSGYRGFLGIEYEGNTLSEDDGIRATRDLLIRLRNELSSEYKLD